MKVSFVVLLLFYSAAILSCFQKMELKNISTAQNANNNVDEKNFNTKSEALAKLENPLLLVKKSQRKLELFDGDKLIKTYRIALGSSPVGDKEKEGDRKTPEGDFYVFTKNDRSNYYLSLGISYPNIADAERGLKAKLITKNEYDEIISAVKNKKMPLQNTKLGGQIYIHGGGNSEDWTWGCIAMKNEEIKEIFDAIPVGTMVKIQP